MAKQGGKAYRQSLAFKTMIRERDHYTCQICGKTGVKEVDHIVPYAILPETKPEGVRVLCRPCNLALRRIQINARPKLIEWFALLDKELDRENCLKLSNIHLNRS